ncbi:hypothetical protein BV20DRAFT_788953 [Pilatotrama ljubarskyi]|nr:hypothetical protein BV20DRAFT_788953 [Pilatotrama ljubarskyi]
MHASDTTDFQVRVSTPQTIEAFRVIVSADGALDYPNPIPASSETMSPTPQNCAVICCASAKAIGNFGGGSHRKPPCELDTNHSGSISHPRENIDVATCHMHTITTYLPTRGCSQSRPSTAAAEETSPERACLEAQTRSMMRISCDRASSPGLEDAREGRRGTKRRYITVDHKHVLSAKRVNSAFRSATGARRSHECGQRA